MRATTSLILGLPKVLRRSLSDGYDVIVFAKTMLPGCRSEGTR